MSNVQIHKQVLAYIEHPFFQIPVCSFIEQKCLVFSPSLSDCEEYRKIYAEYQKLLSDLFDGMVKDLKLSRETFLKVIRDMHVDGNIDHRLYKGIEQVMAVENYPLFVQLMHRMNVELQEQALLMMLHLRGCKFLEDDPNMGGRGDVDDEDDPILQMVLEESRREFEESQRKGSKSASKGVTITEAEVKKIQRENQRDKKRIEDEIMRLTLQEDDEDEDTTVGRHPHFAASNRGSSTAVKVGEHENFESRQAFLREQRDKLLAMKQKEREKMLKSLETKDRGARPASARNARNALSSASSQISSSPAVEEDPSRLAMRKAIAEKLKSEVIRR